MLFTIRGIIPKTIRGIPPTDAVDDFTRKLCKYSQLISDIKKTSVANSTPSLLSKAVKNELAQCKAKDRNDEDKSPQLLHRYKIQGQVMNAAHKSKMNDYNNNDKLAYGWRDLLASEEWNNYIDDPTNDVTRAAFLDKMAG
jgi:hypothetical protein